MPLTILPLTVANKMTVRQRKKKKHRDNIMLCKKSFLPTSHAELICKIDRLLIIVEEKIKREYISRFQCLLRHTSTNLGAPGENINDVNYILYTCYTLFINISILYILYNAIKVLNNLKEKHNSQ